MWLPQDKSTPWAHPAVRRSPMPPIRFAVRLTEPIDDLAALGHGAKPLGCNLVDLDAYVAEHAGEWRRLDNLSGRRRLTAAEADELVVLYQRAATHLSAIRSRSPDPV